jgi:muramoyltetrapeptide carboxypeptidase
MITRGGFLGVVAVGTAMASIASFPEKMRKPPMLRRGDRVGLIAPASPPDPSEITIAQTNMHDLGLVPVLGANVHARDGYLAGSDAQRAEDFNTMARDPSIRAIIAVRGGYGTMRILDRLDYAAIRNDPKVVMGYSDLTAVINAVATRSGVIAFHGPVAAHGSSFDGEARRYIERTLMTTELPPPLRIPSPQTIVAGRASGRIAGGNLSLIAALTGTPFAVAAENAILFFEETHEAPYRIDRMLTQLHLSGALRSAAGILAGRCVDCTGDGPTPTAGEVIAQTLRANDRPAVTGAEIGHIATQWVMPIGLPAELDAETGMLTFLEAAVGAR